MPVTCGALMLVPLIVMRKVLDVFPPALDDTMFVPGAAISGFSLSSPVGPELELGAGAGGVAR
jgi:hypothetical protein